MITRTDIDCTLDQDDVILTVKLRWPAASFIAIARKIHEAMHPLHIVDHQGPVINHLKDPSK